MAEHPWRGAALAASVIDALYLVAASVAGAGLDMVASAALMAFPATALFWGFSARSLRNRPERGLSARAQASTKMFSNPFAFGWPFYWFLGFGGVFAYRDLGWQRTATSVGTDDHLMWVVIGLLLAGMVLVWAAPALMRRRQREAAGGDGQWQTSHPWAAAFPGTSVTWAFVWIVIVTADTRSPLGFRVGVAVMVLSFASVALLYRGSISSRSSALAVQRALVTEERWGAATLSWETTLEEGRKRGDLDAESVALARLGNLLRGRGELDEATQCYERVAEIRRLRSDRRGQIVALLDLGDVYSEGGRWDVATACFEEVLSAVPGNPGQRQLRALALNRFGNLRYRQGRWRDALALHGESLALGRALGGGDPEALALANLGRDYAALGQWDDAISSSQESLSLLRDLGNRAQEVCVLHDLAWAFRNNECWAQAIAHYEQTIALARQIGDLRGEGRSLAALAYAYEALGQLQRADDHWRQALMAYDRLGDAEAERIRATRVPWL